MQRMRWRRRSTRSTLAQHSGVTQLPFFGASIVLAALNTEVAHGLRHKTDSRNRLLVARTRTPRGAPRAAADCTLFGSALAPPLEPQRREQRAHVTEQAQ